MVLKFRNRLSIVRGLKCVWIQPYLLLPKNRIGMNQMCLLLTLAEYHNSIDHPQNNVKFSNFLNLACLFTLSSLYEPKHFLILFEQYFHILFQIHSVATVDAENFRP